MNAHTMENATTQRRRADMAESMLHAIDRSTTRATRISIFHLLSLAAIGASLALFVSGKRTEAIFVGLWPPTFEALKSAASRMLSD